MSKEGKQLFDLSTLDIAAKAEEGAELSLVHPVTGEELGVYLRIAGKDSEIHLRAIRQLADKRSKKHLRNKLTAEDVERDSMEIRARVTLSWRGVVLDGEELPCNRENALALYRRFPWIVEQVDEFVYDRGNYLRD
jgi:hypothetical protein